MGIKIFKADGAAFATAAVAAFSPDLLISQKIRKIPESARIIEELQDWLEGGICSNESVEYLKYISMSQALSKNKAYAPIAIINCEWSLPSFQSVWKGMVYDVIAPYNLDLIESRRPESPVNDYFSLHSLYVSKSHMAMVPFISECNSKWLYNLLGAPQFSNKTVLVLAVEHASDLLMEVTKRCSQK